jgi:hypothetical protein
MRVVILRHLRTGVSEGMLIALTKRWDDVDHRCGPGLATECAREDRVRGLWRDASCMSWIGDDYSWRVYL